MLLELPHPVLGVAGNLPRKALSIPGNATSILGDASLIPGRTASTPASLPISTPIVQGVMHTGDVFATDGSLAGVRRTDSLSPSEGTGIST